MMDKNMIRESGMLERYLLGELSLKEEMELELVLKTDSELKAEFEALEADFEKMAMENAIEPPASVKNELMKRIVEDETPVIPIDNDRGGRGYLIVAASLALLFGLSTFWMYNRMNALEDDLRVVEDNNTLLETQNDELRTNLNTAITTRDELAKWYEAINNPNAIKLVMNGNEKSPGAQAISYVNHQAKTVVVDASGLPELPKENDYQLWADVDGEMIDMGVIPKNSEMIAMTYIDKAESLNITIEPEGGNDHPTVEQLISNVYLE